MIPPARPSSTQMNLNLEKSVNSCQCKRQLTLHSNHLMAIGGPIGTVTALDLNTTTIKNHSDTRTESAFRIIKQFDDAVCALAFSSDGQRVAVGYDNGQVRIFMFTKEQLNDSRCNGNGNVSIESDNGGHPFVENVKRKVDNESQSQENDDDDDDDLLEDMLTMTQTETDDNAPSSLSSALSLSSSFALSRRFDSEIRCLSFQPNTTTADEKYHLAIALESSPGFLIADVTSPNSVKHYLEEDSITQYQQAGVRHLSFSPSGQILATLGCDGRLCLWNTPSGDSSDPELDWELYHADTFKVARVDAGVFSEVWDKAMACVWSSNGEMLGLSGSKDLQIRRKSADDADGNSNTVWLKKDKLVLATNENGKDMGEIVAIAFDPLNKGYVVTSFKHGQVGVWKLKDDVKNEEEPEGKFLGFLELVANTRTELNTNDNDDEDGIQNEAETASLCTHILWDKQESMERLYLAMDNGCMYTIRGRDQIIPTPIASAKADGMKRATVEVNDEPGAEEETQEFEFETQPSHPNPTETSMNDKKRLKKMSSSNDKHDNNDISQDSDDDLLFENDADVDNADNADSIGKVSKNQFVADEAEQQNDDEIGGGHSLNNDEDSDDEDKKDVGVDSFGTGDDDGKVSSTGVRFHDDDGMDADGDDYEFHHTRKPVAALPEPQAPFAPSSTPLGTSRRRILCWNHHGVITSRQGDGIQRTIDFSFVDSASRRPASFRDPHNYIIGTVGEEGGLFVSDLKEDFDDDDEFRDDLLDGMSDATKAVVRKSGRRRTGGKKDRATGSNIYFHRFDTFGPVKDKDWHLALPEGERALGCASGEGWNAVATNRRFVRMFSTGGMQGPIVWVKGDLVTIVGRGRLLAVIYHEANPLVDGTQKLGYALYDGVTAKLIVEGSVSAISPGSSLMWAGFASDLSLCIVDQEGMVSMLVASKIEGFLNFTYKWVPMLDTLGLKKSREDHFWPVAIQNAKLICVPLKGVKHPDASRRPLTTSFSMRMPLARGTGGRSIALDEVCVRANLALENKQFMNDLDFSLDSSENAEDVEKEYSDMCIKADKVTLKLLFSLLDSDEGGFMERAFDITRRLHHEKSYDLAIKAADLRGLMKLSDRILDAKEDRFNEEDDDGDEGSFDDQSIDEPIDYTPTDQPVRSRRVSPISSTKRKERDEDSEHSDDDTSQPKPVHRRRLNPFAKTHKESPSKTVMDSPLVKKPTLSRMSTFSAQSRQKSKQTKHLL